MFQGVGATEITRAGLIVPSKLLFQFGKNFSEFHFGTDCLIAGRMQTKD
jgi:hypothetical protein